MTTQRLLLIIIIIFCLIQLVTVANAGKFVPENLAKHLVGSSSFHYVIKRVRVGTFTPKFGVFLTY